MGPWRVAGGNVWQRYAAEEGEVGRGHCGAVRVCRDRLSGERLACKSISKGHLVAAQDREEFQREVRAMEAMRGHANIVQLRDVFEDACHVHLVMELCDAGELFDLIVERRRLPEEEARLLFRQVAEAVAACHARGWMHRDLKPENILLKRVAAVEGAKKPPARLPPGRPASELQVKLIDFGLALDVGSGDFGVGIAGSPHYMAPEIVSFAKYGKEADVWSLGVVLYAMLSGDLPFVGHDDAMVYHAIESGEVAMDGAPWPAISEAAKDLVRSLLVADPRQRLTAAQVLRHPWFSEEEKVW